MGVTQDTLVSLSLSKTYAPYSNCKWFDKLTMTYDITNYYKLAFSSGMYCRRLAK
jgi:hypothetical protein